MMMFFRFPQILYTGDFSREEDRHLVAAEVPRVKPHILITVRICATPQLSSRAAFN